MSSTVEHSEVLIIGAGPGGYVAAIRAAQLGKQVTLVEEQELGGVCLNRGCIPSKALIHAADIYEQMLHSAENGMGISSSAVTMDFTQVQKWKQGIVEKLQKGIQGLIKNGGIRLIKGRAVFSSLNSIELLGEQSTRQFIEFEHCIIATGSSPFQLPAFPFGARILSSTELLQLPQPPDRLIVIGGGYIGVELGQAFAKLGSKVTILEGESQLLPAFDSEISSHVLKKMKSAGMTIVTGAIAKAYVTTDESIQIQYAMGQELHEVKGDYLLVAVGRTPNTRSLELVKANVKVDHRGLIEVDKQCRSSNSRIFAIGDVTEGFALAHRASHEAKIAAEVIANKEHLIDYRVIPSVVFSDPEIAAAGMSEQEAKAQNLQVKIGKFNYGANGRALTMNAGVGFVKLIAEQPSGRLLGAEIVGSEASNLIAEVVLAIEMGASLEDIALTIHAHPSLGEIIMEASEDGLGQGIHGLRKQMMPLA